MEFTSAVLVHQPRPVNRYAAPRAPPPEAPTTIADPSPLMATALPKPHVPGFVSVALRLQPSPSRVNTHARPFWLNHAPMTAHVPSSLRAALTPVADDRSQPAPCTGMVAWMLQF